MINKKEIQKQAVRIAKTITGYLPEDDERHILAQKGALRMAEWFIDNMWTRVNDKLPKPGERVLCSNDLDVMIGTINDDLDCEGDDCTILCGVTRWMSIQMLNEGLK